MTEDIPKIKKTHEVGDMPFQVVEIQEEILQGWSARQQRQMYLFKNENGQWSYFDKMSGSIKEVTEWKERSANIGGDWVAMTKYFRVHVRFFDFVQYTEWNGAMRQNVLVGTDKAILTLTKTSFEKLQKTIAGKPPDSWYRLIYRTVNQKKRTIVYVDDAVYIDPANMPTVKQPAPINAPGGTALPPQAMPQQQTTPPPQVSSQPPSDLAPSLPNTNVVSYPQNPAPTPPPGVTNVPPF